MTLTVCGTPARVAHTARVGDFVWSNQRLPYTQSGQWCYLRVLPAGDTRIQPLDAADQVRNRRRRGQRRFQLR